MLGSLDNGLVLLPGLIAEGFKSLTAGGLFGSGALLLLRGALHLRGRPTVLPLADLGAGRFSLMLLGLSAPRQTRWGRALSVATGLIATLGGRYLSYPTGQPIEVIATDASTVEAAARRVVSGVWTRESDDLLLGPLPVISVVASPTEPGVVWVMPQPETPASCCILRAGLAQALDQAGPRFVSTGLAMTLVGISLMRFALWLVS